MITVLFTCDKCGLKKQPLQVPAREHEGVDIRIYMEKMTYWVADEHRRLSPNCDAEKITQLMIPTAGADFIGQQVE